MTHAKEFIQALYKTDSIEKVLGVLLEFGGATQKTIFECQSSSNLLKFKQAFVHYTGNERLNYQRFEFFGDSVINKVVAEFLIDKYPNYSHADLTIVKHKIVASKFLGENMTIQANLFKYITPSLNIIESVLRQKLKPPKFEKEMAKLPGDLIEAIIGALYIIIKENTMVGVADVITGNIIRLFLDSMIIPSREADAKTIIKNILDKNPDLGKITENVIQKKQNKDESTTVYIQIYPRGRSTIIGTATDKDEYRAEMAAFVVALRYLRSNPDIVRIKPRGF